MLFRPLTPAPAPAGAGKNKISFPASGRKQKTLFRHISNYNTVLMCWLIVRFLLTICSTFFSRRTPAWLMTGLKAQRDSLRSCTAHNRQMWVYSSCHRTRTRAVDRRLLTRVTRRPPPQTRPTRSSRISPPSSRPNRDPPLLCCRTHPRRRHWPTQAKFIVDESRTKRRRKRNSDRTHTKHRLDANADVTLSSNYGLINPYWK